MDRRPALDTRKDTWNASVMRDACAYNNTSPTGRGHRVVDSDAEQFNLHLHEIRNALSAVLLSFQGWQRQHKDVRNPALERSLNRLQKLLDLSSLPMNGTANVVLRRLSVVELIDEASSMLTSAFQHYESRLVRQDGADLHVLGERTLLVSVLSNLFQNAVHYSRQRAAIEVRCKSEGAHVLLEIEDGCGGLMDGLETRMFEPHVRGCNDRIGMGLGLTVARRAAQACGGLLTVRNNPPKGCIFTLELARA